MNNTLLKILSLSAFAFFGLTESGCTAETRNECMIRCSNEANDCLKNRGTSDAMRKICNNGNISCNKACSLKR